MRPALPMLAAAAAAASAAFAAPAAHAADYASVVSSSPVTAPVAVRRQVCSDGQQYLQQAPSGAGALIGAIAGGVLGHSVGAGFGRAAATGIGVVAGSVIGNQVEANTNPVAEVPVRRCQTATSYENRIVGYDVMYDYAGQRYSTRMARDPGQRFAVSVQPADAANTRLPAPVYGAAAPLAYDEPAPRASYDDEQASQPVYYEPVPRGVYYAPSPALYVAPMIGFGVGYYGGGYYGGYRGRRWR